MAVINSTVDNAISEFEAIMAANQQNITVVSLFSGCGGNVKGLLMRHNADSLQRVLSDFRTLGYEVNYHLYHAVDYGVPQTRERVFIVGTRPDVPKFIPPKPVCGKHITAVEARVEATQATRWPPVPPEFLQPEFLQSSPLRLPFPP